MGVNPTQSNFKSFTFGGINSRQYGVYITGGGVFNAPERNVEMVEIPGRNGAYALDKGNFNNIEVTYPAGIFADTEADFAKAVADLRSFLCSQSGYVRLEDDYNPNEYRLAIYKSGLDVSHDMLINGEFDLVFTCKPQRYLKSGETAISVTSGDTVTNPTLFDAKPMIEATGYGTIGIGGAEIEVDNIPIGQVVVHNNEIFQATNTAIATIDDTYANASDVITVENITFNASFASHNGTLGGVSVSVSGDVTGARFSDFNDFTNLISRMEGIQFAYGTSNTKTGTVAFVANASDLGNVTITAALSVAYDGANTFTVSVSYTKPTGIKERQTSQFPSIKFGSVILDSTQSSLGHPMYIDLDIGECYKIESGSVVSVNNAVQLPSELPTLASGANVITYENTFTSVDIVPRWWSV